MRKIEFSEIWGPKLYEPIRQEFRDKIIQIKKHRRIQVGPQVSLVFENRETLKFQIEEMLRAESITDPSQTQAEMDVYNALLPGDSELSATLFLEIPAQEDSRDALHRLIGIDEHVFFHVGNHAIKAQFEPGRQESDRISAVQYVRFPLFQEAKQTLLAAGSPLAIVIQHPQYRHRKELDESIRVSLAKDLIT